MTQQTAPLKYIIAKDINGEALSLSIDFLSELFIFFFNILCTIITYIRVTMKKANEIFIHGRMKYLYTDV